MLKVKPPTCKIVYDGGCSFCTITAKNLNIKNAELIDAREDSSLVNEKEEKVDYFQPYLILPQSTSFIPTSLN